MSDLFEDKNISPMLLFESKPFDSDEYIFELKLDGIRCIAYVDSKSVTLQNKRHKDVTSIYPELGKVSGCVRKAAVLDCELVVLKEGKPDFYALQRRSLMGDMFRITLAARQNPVQLVAYDILYFDGKDLTDLPLLERKRILSENVREGNNLSLSRYVSGQGKAFFELAKSDGLEGIVAKRKDGKYYIGKRTHEWVKIKVMQDEDLTVLGYQTDSEGNVKDLVLGYMDENGKWQCRGKVYLGVSKTDREYILEYAKEHRVEKAYFDRYRDVVWLEQGLIGTAHFMEKTSSGTMRQPVWKGLRPD